MLVHMGVGCYLLTTCASTAALPASCRAGCKQPLRSCAACQSACRVCKCLSGFMMDAFHTVVTILQAR